MLPGKSSSGLSAAIARPSPDCCRRKKAFGSPGREICPSMPAGTGAGGKRLAHLYLYRWIFPAAPDSGGKSSRPAAGRKPPVQPALAAGSKRPCPLPPGTSGPPGANIRFLCLGHGAPGKRASLPPAQHDAHCTGCRPPGAGSRMRLCRPGAAGVSIYPGYTFFPIERSLYETHLVRPRLFSAGKRRRDAPADGSLSPEHLPSRPAPLRCRHCFS